MAHWFTHIHLEGPTFYGYDRLYTQLSPQLSLVHLRKILCYDIVNRLCLDSYEL